MSEINAKQVAAYLVNHDECEFPNTFDGNMKLQKLLTFANIIHIYKNDEVLFPEDMYAFKNGIVVENVRKPFAENYMSYINELKSLDSPVFNKYQIDSINASIAIFNKLSASELSLLQHELETWEYKYNKSKLGTTHIKELGKINKEELFETDLNRIKKVINGYERSKNNHFLSETVNDITFYYDPKEFNFFNNDRLMEELENISREVQRGDETTFFLTYDENQGVYYY